MLPGNLVTHVLYLLKVVSMAFPAEEARGALANGAAMESAGGLVSLGLLSPVKLE